MRVSWLSLAAGLAMSLAGCRCVDLSSVQAFGCAEGGRCPTGLSCCSDSTCRASCSTAIQGGGTGAGGGQQGGGSATGGGGTTGGGPATCDATSCPNGCCDGTTCVTSTSAAACGHAGAQCQTCPGTEACVDGACEGCLETCATGCCTGTTCAAPSVTTCGAPGSVCSACGMTADTCSGGQCTCGSGAACAIGQRCSNGACVCDATSCAEGCCTSAGTCLRATQQSGAQCGLNGVACGGCDTPPTPTCSSSTERTAYRSPGTCAAGVCEYPPLTLTCPFSCTGGLCDGDQCQGCLVAPPSSCVGAVRRTFQSPGACQTSDAGVMGCQFTQVDTTCAFGCTNGVCNPDPCSGVLCEQPPAPRCNGSTRYSYASPGSCSAGNCSYAEMQTPCQFGCNSMTGQCNGDPCAGVTCDSPPLPTCNGATRHSFISPGACSGGSCTYAPQDTVCASGCAAGVCQGADPCQGITCAMPPAPICLNGTTRRTYASSGTCANGSCSYGPTDQACPFGCVGGSCVADPCSGVSCNTPPGPTCQGNLRRTFAPMGTCSSGNCSYMPTDAPCNSAPAPTCMGSTLRTFASAGVCSSGSCTYSPTDTVCSAGCSNGMCNTDPCAGVSCTTPPAATCTNSTTRRVSGSPGTCSGGSCSYPAQDFTCNAPPPASCLNASTLRAYSAAGTCSGGTCSYSFNDTTCANGCSNGACAGDPCAGVTCNQQPAATCANATTRRTYAASGTCAGGSCTYGFTDLTCNSPPAATCVTASTLRTYPSTGSCASGVCSYSPTDSPCAFGCSGGSCNPDPCAGVSCNSPGAPDCANSTTRRTFGLPGVCSNGSCSYQPSLMACTSPPASTCADQHTVRDYNANGTCSGGTCSYSPVDTACSGPPAAFCVGSNVRTFANPGDCVPGAGVGGCSYAPTDTPCSFGCSNGVCIGDPCAGVTCNSPPASSCDDPYTLRIYSSSGSCSGGTCSYGSSTSNCQNGCANGACLPCNSATCSTGCCSGNSCLEQEFYCRGTNGQVCRTTGCTGGRVCDFGVCVCALRAPTPPELQSVEPMATSDDPNLICP